MRGNCRVNTRAPFRMGQVSTVVPMEPKANPPTHITLPYPLWTQKLTIRRPPLQFPSHATDMPCETGHSNTLPLLHPQLVNNQWADLFDIRFWANIYSMSIDSSQCLSEVQSLLSCSSGIALVRSFRGNEAQMFVDFLDQVS